MFNIKNKKTGFTLIELLVVVAIISLLSSVVLVSVNTAREKARDSHRAQQIKQITTALELYKNKYGYYPQQTQITALCNVGDYGSSLDVLVSEGFLADDPNDPVSDDSRPYRLCFQYLGLGQASSYGTNSAWYCDDVWRNDLEYALFFSTESTIFDFPRIKYSSGSIISEYTHCVPGPLLN